MKDEFEEKIIDIDEGEEASFDDDDEGEMAELEADKEFFSDTYI